MSDAKVSALTALAGTDVADGDLVPIVDVSATATKKITRNELRAAIFNSDYIVIPAAFEAAGGFIVNPGGVGKTFYSSHGLASIGEGAFSYAGFTYAALTHTLKTGVAGDVDALVLAADGSANFPVGASVDGDDVVTDGTLAAALAALGEPLPRTVVLDGPAIAALADSYFELVEEAGASTLLVPKTMLLAFKPNGGIPVVGAGSTPYLKFGYEDVAGTTIRADVFGAGNELVMQTTDSAKIIVPQEINTYAFFSLADCLNKPLVVGFAGPTLEVPGAIATSSIASAGTGYLAGDTFAVTTDYGTAAHGVIDTVVPVTGAVATFHITDPATGYTKQEGSYSTSPSGAQPASGTDFEINVDSVDASVNPVTLEITTWYARRNFAP